MARLIPALLAVLLLAIAGASVAFAQANCQPTLTQPCAKPQTKPTDQASAPAARADEEPIDHSKRIRIDKDTDFNFGFGGFGLKQKF
jgi:curli biogenesis system outer membrane secretion channel CsgG